MDKINLKANHRRSVSSAIRLVENMAEEIEREINNPRRLLLTRINHEENENDISHIQSIIKKIKSQIRYLFDKYDLKPSELNMQRIINSRKSSMWVILCDTTAGKLKGYGEFPEEYSAEFDSDIEKLQEIVSEL